MVSARRQEYALAAKRQHVEGVMGTGIVRTGMVKVLSEDGNPLVVDEYTEVLDEGTISFPGAELVGLHEYRLGEDPCNLQKDGSFIVLRTGQRLRRR